jgi:hypothetical protein
MMKQSGDDVALVLEALKIEIERAGHSWRKMELSLNLGNGYFSHLFAGRIELKFRHVVAITEVLGLSTRDFFLRAYEVVPRPDDGSLRTLLHEVVDAELNSRGLPPRGTRAREAAQREAAQG